MSRSNGRSRSTESDRSYVQVHATPLRGESTSRPTGSVLVMNDITRLKHLEDLRRDFVANVSHELKTPITSIKGFVETLLDGASGDAATVERFLQIILNHTNRLHLIIEDLLSLSRLEQNDQRVALQRFPLQAIIDQTLEICGPRASEKRIELSFATTGDGHAWGIPNLIEQALVNLVDNAIKYSPEGSIVRIDIAKTDRRLVIRVIDHGQGIRAQDLPRIFERFYRTDKARSRELGGYRSGARDREAHRQGAPGRGHRRQHARSGFDLRRRAPSGPGDLRAFRSGYRPRPERRRSDFRAGLRIG